MLVFSGPVDAFQGANGRIAFISKRDGSDFEVYTMNADGTNVVRLTDNNADEERPGFSPDGTKIVYSSQSSGNGDIFVMNANGTGKTQLTNDAAMENGAQWSSDGTTILYKKMIGSNESGHGDIWAMNSDGTNKRPFIASSYDENGPVWEPNNLGVAFSGKRAGDVGPNIFTANTTGSNITRLTSGDGHNFAAAWSPDGNKIAFRSGRNGGENRTPDIFIMNKDGSNQQALVTNPKQDRGPAWSPDGTKIVFYSNRPNAEGGTDTDYDIWVVNSSNGANPVNLTANSPADDWNPDWGVSAGTPPPSPTPSPTPSPRPSPRASPSVSPTPLPSSSSSPSPSPFDFDFNDDGVVSHLDTKLLIQRISIPVAALFDADTNGKVNSLDFGGIMHALDDVPSPSSSPSPLASPSSSPSASPSNWPSPTPSNPPVNDEVVLLDETMKFEYNDSGFHRLIDFDDPLPAGVPLNWKQPVNYWTGIWQYRIQILEHPTDRNGQLQLCLWNIIDFTPENCAFNIDHTGVGTYLHASTPSIKGYGNGGWAYIKGGPLDFLTPDNYRTSIILRHSSGCTVTKKNVEKPCANYDTFFDYYKDMRFRITVVMVPGGATFSGWTNY